MYTALSPYKQELWSTVDMIDHQIGFTVGNAWIMFVSLSW